MINIPIDDVLEKIPTNDVEEKKDNSVKSDSEEITDFDSLLNQLSSGEARINAIDAAFKRGVPLEQKNLKLLFDIYHDKKDFWKAGAVAEKYNINLALETYLSIPNGAGAGDAGRIYEQLGMLRDAIEQYLKAAPLNNKKYYYKAAELSKKLGYISDAITYFEKSGNSGYYEAGKLSEQIKDYTKALILYTAGQCKNEYDRLYNSKEYKTSIMLEYEKNLLYETAYKTAKEIDDKEKMKLYKSLAKIIFNADID